MDEALIIQEVRAALERNDRTFGEIEKILIEETDLEFSTYEDFTRYAAEHYADVTHTPGVVILFDEDAVFTKFY